MRLPCLTILAGLAALPAAARCPATPADAAAGIDVAFADGSTARLKVDADGLMRNETAYNDGSGLGELVIGWHGYLTTQMWVMKDGFMTSAAVMFRTFPAAPPAPVATGERQELRATSELAEVTFDDVLIVEGGAETTLTIGDCVLRARPVSVTLQTIDPPEVERSMYLPDVGVAILMSISGGTAADLNLEPVSIAVAD